MSAADLCILGGTVVTAAPDGQVVADGGIAVVGETIAAIGPRAEIESHYQAARTVFADGMFIFPGLVDTHTHLYQTLLKGLGDDLPLMEWLDACTLPSIPHLTPRMCYVAAALGCIESLRSGCTTIFDYMVDHHDTEVYDAILQAFVDVGIQGVLGRGLRDRQPENVTARLPSMSDQLADCARLVDAYGTQRIWIAPGATWALEADSLVAARRLASERGMRMSLHTDEVVFDSQESLRRFGQRTVPFLESIGFLGPDVLHAHCVQLTEEDCRILARHDAKVSYNPVSNMYLGSGVPPVPRLLDLGVTVGLGADGAASNNSQDMLEALKVGALFIFDPRHAKSIPVHDPVSTLVYSSGQMNVRTTVVGGRVVLDDGRLVGLDEAAILREAQMVAEELSLAAGTRARLQGRWAVRRNPAEVLS
jgi:5-methylthioadenosine/S-adenosylhomocysteine deaminase